MAVDSTARKLAAPAAPVYRVAPHNIEAEQALLGAILVNNEAFYRVSDFLEPVHFFEPIHQQIYQLARDLIRAGKLATPVTLKTFLDASVDIGGLTVGQYLARLAAEATTIINAEDYGRTVYDLSVRRALIQVGEDMVNVAFDAPVDFSPRDQIEDAERRLYELAETGRYDGGFQRFAQALTTAIDMNLPPTSPPRPPSSPRSPTRRCRRTPSISARYRCPALSGRWPRPPRASRKRQNSVSTAPSCPRQPVARRPSRA